VPSGLDRQTGDPERTAGVALKQVIRVGNELRDILFNRSEIRKFLRGYVEPQIALMIRFQGVVSEL
jgi:hypothetical protein